MKKAVVIDPSLTNRASVVHQLSNLKLGSVLQISHFSEALRQISSSPKFEGFIFVGVAEDFNQSQKLIADLRNLHPGAVILAMTGQLTFNEVRGLIGVGVDQILIRPFNANQLIEKVQAAETFRHQVIKENETASSQFRFGAHLETITGKFYRVTLSGWLGEGSVLPDVSHVDLDSTLFVECGQLRGMNSVGIRIWTLWRKVLRAAGFFRIEFENVRPAFLQQMSLTGGLIDDQCAVNSFFMRYHCADQNLTTEVKMSFGVQFATDRMIIQKEFTKVVDGRELKFELDEVPQKLLRFYKGQIEIR